MTSALDSNEISSKKTTGIDSNALGREAHMLAYGVGGAIADTIEHLPEKLPELAISVGIGAALGVVSKSGAPGRMIAAGAGVCMLGKFVYDEVSGHRWSDFGQSVVNAWGADANMKADIDATKNSLGSFVVDTGIGMAGFKVGGMLAGVGAGALTQLTARWNFPTLKSLLMPDLEPSFAYEGGLAGAAPSSLGRLAEQPSSPSVSSIFAFMGDRPRWIGPREFELGVRGDVPEIGRRRSMFSRQREVPKPADASAPKATLQELRKKLSQLVEKNDATRPPETAADYLDRQEEQMRRELSRRANLTAKKAAKKGETNSHQ